MSYWVLPESGIVQSHTTVQHVTKEDYANPKYRAAIDNFYRTIKERLNDEHFVIATEHGTNKLYLEDEPTDPAHGNLKPVHPDYEDTTFPEPADDEEDSGVDHYLNTEVVLDTPNGPQFGKVVDRVKHPDGRKIGSPHRNPLFDTREYFVEFPDQSRAWYTANTIAENLYAQCDSEGNMFRILDEITDHRCTEAALSGDDRYKTLRNGTKAPKKTVKGWEFCVTYKGGESEWIDAQTVKDSNPIEAAEYALVAELGQEPAFIWWVHDVVRHKHRIISKVKSRYWKTTHKYGI